MSKIRCFECGKVYVTTRSNPDSWGCPNCEKPRKTFVKKDGVTLNHPFEPSTENNGCGYLIITRSDGGEERCSYPASQHPRSQTFTVDPYAVRTQFAPATWPTKETEK